MVYFANRSFNMAINQNDMFRAVGPWFSDSWNPFKCFTPGLSLGNDLLYVFVA